MNYKIWVVLIGLFIGGCASKPQVVKEIEVVETSVPSYKPLDSRLTTAAPEPAPPKAKCVYEGQPTVCTGELLDHMDALQVWGRGLHRQVTEILGLQPKP